MAEQYVSLRVIHDRVTRHPLMQSISLNDVVDYTIDFMRIVGVPSMFVNKIEHSHTDAYKVKLPCDYVELIQLSGRRGIYRYSTDTFHLDYSSRKYQPTGVSLTITPDRSCCEHCLECLNRPTCDEYHYDFNKVECISFLRGSAQQPVHNGKSNTFIIQNGYIWLSNQVDDVTISYRAILTDAEGMPMIPENSNFYRALVAYIKKEYFTILFDLNTISQQVLFQAQQDYAWAVGSCETDMLKLDLSKAEALLNVIKTPINKNNEFATGFESNGDKVIRKTH